MASSQRDVNTKFIVPTFTVDCEFDCAGSSDHKSSMLGADPVLVRDAALDCIFYTFCSAEDIAMEPLTIQLERMGTIALEAGINMETASVPPRRPCRKRYDEDLDRMTNSIKLKETELRFLQQPIVGGDQGDPSVGGRLPPTVSLASPNPANVWQQRDETSARRREIDERLQAANREITNMRDALARIHSTLNYKSEDRINEAIKRLEYQLRVNNFKVNEEKRIVKEIDTLNRSRGKLKEYLDKKSDLDKITKDQQLMRSDRDAFFRTEIELRQKGETIRKEAKERKARMEVLKKELDDLHDEKRQLSASFRQSFSKYQQHRAEHNKRQFQKKDKDVDQCKGGVPVEAFSEERNLCLALLGYLQRFEYSQVNSALTPNMAIHEFLAGHNLPISEGHTPVTPTEDCTILRRKEECLEEDWSVWGTGRGARAKRNHSKKLRQQMKKKAITHTPQVFEQFSRLLLSAPALLCEVPVAIEQLKAKKKFYEHLSQADNLEEVPDLPLYSLSSANVHSQDSCQNAKIDIFEEPAEEDTPTQDMEKLKLVCEPSTLSDESVTPDQTANSAPKTPDLENNNYVLHFNGFQNFFEDMDMGYSSENGYSKFENGNCAGILKAQIIES